MTTTSNETQILILKRLKEAFVEPTYNQGQRHVRIQDFDRKINVLLDE